MKWIFGDWKKRVPEAPLLQTKQGAGGGIIPQQRSGSLYHFTFLRGYKRDFGGGESTWARCFLAIENSLFTHNSSEKMAIFFCFAFLVQYFDKTKEAISAVY